MKWWRAHGARRNSLSLSEINLSDDFRVRSCPLSGAIGDASDYTVEFKSLNSIRVSYGEAGIQEPEETDYQFLVSNYTQKTLFNLEGLIRGPNGAEETMLREIRLTYIDLLLMQSTPENGLATERSDSFE